MVDDLLGHETEQNEELSALQEIKDLMNARLGNKLKDHGAKGLAMERMEVIPEDGEGSPSEELGESPEEEKAEDGSMGMDPEELEKIKGLYSKY